MMRIEYFLMKGRTKNQIMERFGHEALDALESMEKFGMVRHRTENN